ncbi:protein TIC 55 [Pyrus ussuriensis x Pyrus communis]|uniref:Protein TIC 55 n=1 Tax=Pyrus ussuriensis x Pyrus communis TaxID=2448454 RepID=A0A5N5HMV0_9ROSA|nr:protein TIC 55 [Pyrus ussuriensis x Pyrus communis]
MMNMKSVIMIICADKFLSRVIVASLLNHDDDLKEDEQEDHKVLVTPSKEEEHGEESVATVYNWTEEWYPLYLTQDLPEDAPLGLTVFNKQLVLYRDGSGELRCYEDRCPHRLAKLSKGHLINGRLECLYHGWQFERQGKCVKIPQLPSDAKIPRAACVKSYEVRDSQGVVRLPYDHSILLENLMDPAHIPISHDRTGFSVKRENAQPLRFEVIERSDTGFAGYYGEAKDQHLPFFLRFEAPGVIENTREIVDKNGEKHYSVGLFLCRPTGQGKSVAIMRFGATKLSPLAKLFPTWYFHHISCRVFKQDMGFLSSQNEILSREKRPATELYLNLKSSDVWVIEYRKWVDKVSNGMPYHVGHSKIGRKSSS